MTAEQQLGGALQIRRTLGLLRSAMLSGEPWSDTCEHEFVAAMEAIKQLDPEHEPRGYTGAALLERDHFGRLKAQRDYYRRRWLMHGLIYPRNQGPYVKQVQNAWQRARSRDGD